MNIDTDTALPPADNLGHPAIRAIRRAETWLSLLDNEEDSAVVAAYAQAIQNAIGRAAARLAENADPALQFRLDEARARLTTSHAPLQPEQQPAPPINGDAAAILRGMAGAALAASTTQEVVIPPPVELPPSANKPARAVPPRRPHHGRNFLLTSMLPPDTQARLLGLAQELSLSKDLPFLVINGETQMAIEPSFWEEHSPDSLREALIAVADYPQAERPSRMPANIPHDTQPFDFQLAGDRIIVGHRAIELGPKERGIFNVMLLHRDVGVYCSELAQQFGMTVEECETVMRTLKAATHSKDPKRRLIKLCERSHSLIVGLNPRFIARDVDSGSLAAQTI